MLKVSQGDNIKAFNTCQLCKENMPLSSSQSASQTQNPQPPPQVSVSFLSFLQNSSSVKGDSTPLTPTSQLTTHSPDQVASWWVNPMGSFSKYLGGLLVTSGPVGLALFLQISAPLVPMVSLCLGFLLLRPLLPHVGSSF